ncbi:hypothetical protein HY468_02230 [Candidatus Roizmanbacteria bacterium]|nr:hypothetical protein [Candidatus Roizmanbacteria bacterium]
MKLSFLTQALTVALEKSRQTIGTPGGERISISRTVSAVAVLYEKVRVAMEYREEHLMRRAAIERIIKRRLILNENGRGIAEYLLKELLWAKYAPEDSIPIAQIPNIQRTVDKYIFLRNEIGRGRPREEQMRVHEWLISSAAAEVEQKLAPNQEREAFINFIFRYFQKKVFLKDETDQTKNIQVYVAVHHAFAKSDDDFIRYELLKLSFPHLFPASWKEVQNETGKIYETLISIQEQLKHKLSTRLTRSLKKEIAPFLILRDLYEQDKKNFKTIIEDTAKLEEHIDRLCRKRYQEIGKKYATAATRSIIYIFLTKMLFAIALEYPFERYIAKAFNPVPLVINTVFPPILMFVALIGISAPGQDNTKRIIARLKEILYQESSNEHQITLALKTPQGRPFLRFIFSLLYLITFTFVFGVITLYLTILHFNAASIAIFIFFISVVLFFAYRIRQTGREYTIGRKEGIFSPVIHLFLLPILDVGKWLSNEISRLNVLVVIFDFIIEAPFKAIFEVFEEWFSFIKKKKDEII